MPIISEETVKREATDGALGACEALLFSDTGGLTQFSARVEILAPGARSSYKHWHESEDEMIYVLEGDATLIEGEREEDLTAGAAATFPAGMDQGHCLENRSDRMVRYLVVGTRAPRDRVHYPGEDRVRHVERTTGDMRWSHENGAPADPLPK